MQCEGAGMTPTYEWRVLTFFKHTGNDAHTQTCPDEEFARDCPDEEFARDWAKLERVEYPHARVEIQRREVKEWEVVA